MFSTDLFQRSARVAHVDEQVIGIGAGVQLRDRRDQLDLEDVVSGWIANVFHKCRDEVLVACRSQQDGGNGLLFGQWIVQQSQQSGRHVLSSVDQLSDLMLGLLQDQFASQKTRQDVVNLFLVRRIRFALLRHSAGPPVCLTPDRHPGRGDWSVRPDENAVSPARSRPGRDGSSPGYSARWG